MNPDPSVLSAMITPAVLISACGALILSTSVRLGRVVDRVRALADRFEELSMKDAGEVALFADRLELTFTQLDWLTSRARHLQRAMTTFYLALGLFVATAVTLGFVGLTGRAGKGVPVDPGRLRDDRRRAALRGHHPARLRSDAGAAVSAFRDGLPLEAWPAPRAGSAAAADRVARVLPQPASVRSAVLGGLSHVAAGLSYLASGALSVHVAPIVTVSAMSGFLPSRRAPTGTPRGISKNKPGPAL